MRKLYNNRIPFLQIALILIAAIFIFSCENPGNFQRTNPSDPGSLDFVPQVGALEKVEPRTINRNIIELVWPQVYEVSRYKIYRQSKSSSEFTLIHETDDFRDTTYVDQVPDLDHYLYKVEAIAKNSSILPMESNWVISNFVNGPELTSDEFTIRFSDSETFSMKLSESEILIHHIQSSDETPIFSVLNLESGFWEIKEFDDLASNNEYVHASDIYSVNNSQFLVIEDMRYDQTHLGFVCTVASNECAVVGDTLPPESSGFGQSKFAKLQDNSILITLSMRGTATRNPAYIFNPSSNILSETTPPLDGLVPITLSTLDNGNVLGCRLINGDPDITNCQIYNVQTETWHYVSSPPLSGNDLRGGGFNSLTLIDGSVFFLDGYESKAAQAQIYDPATDSWEIIPPNEYSTHRISYDDFVDPIHQLSDGTVMVITEINSKYPYRYYLEVFNLNTFKWVHTFELPAYVERVYSMIEIDTDTYLITFRDEDWGKPRSAIFYAN